MPLQLSQSFPFDLDIRPLAGSSRWSNQRNNVRSDKTGRVGSPKATGYRLKGDIETLFEASAIPG